MAGKAAGAYLTISEVSEKLDVPAHVLRFWETKFTQLKPMKRSGSRRYYRESDIALLERIRNLLYRDGFTIKGAQKALKTPDAGMATPADADASPPISPPGTETGTEAGTETGAAVQADSAQGKPADNRPAYDGPTIHGSASHESANHGQLSAQPVDPQALQEIHAILDGAVDKLDAMIARLQS